MAKPTFASSLQESLDSEIAALKAQRETAVSAPDEQNAPLVPPQDISPVPAPAEFGAPVAGYAAPPSAPTPRSDAPQSKAGGGGRLVIVTIVVAVVAVAVFVLAFPLGLLHYGTSSTSAEPTINPGSGTSAPGTATATPGGAFGPSPSALPTSSVIFVLVGLLLVLIVVVVALVVVRRGRAQAQVTTGLTLTGPGSLGALDQRIVRLEQLRTWMGEDPDLGRLIDTSIGSQVHASERRQRFFAGTLGVITLVAGWLLSAVSPPAALASFLHFGH